jgi:Zn-dependent protease with chaperone function
MATIAPVQPGKPPILSFAAAAEQAFDRQPWACLAGLVSGWTALFAAIWVGALVAIIGSIAGFFAVASVTNELGQASQGFSMVGAIAGFAAGFVAGFGVLYGASIGQAPEHVVISLVIGAAAALVITWVAIALEPLSLDLRSYRRPSRRADEGSLAPLLHKVAGEMGLTSVPDLRVSDEPMPGAWTHASTIVVTKGLLNQMEREEIAGILAHELHHWNSGDPVALRFVWACAIPMVVIVNFYTYVLGRIRGLANFSMVIIWPAVALLRFLMAPLMSARGRDQEYEADAAAIAAGYGPALGRALAKLQDFESARTGWEVALVRTHPPIEFRLEAIEEATAPQRQATSRRRAR